MVDVIFKCGYFLKVLFNKRLSSLFFSVKSVARVQKKSTTTKLMLMRRRSSNFQAHHSQSSCDPLRSIFFLLYFLFFLFFLARVKDFAEEEGRLLTVYVHSKMRNKVNFMHASLFQISKIHS